MHVGGGYGISCQHLQVMMTNLLQKRWEWQEERTPMLRHGSLVRPSMYLARMDIKTAFDEARPRHVAKIMASRNTHGWIISALLHEVAGLEGQAMFECVESTFSFNRCFRQGSVEAPRLWQKMATQLLVKPSSLEHSVFVDTGVRCVCGCLCLCMTLSRFRRLSGVGIVLASLALDGCFGMVSDGFPCLHFSLVPCGKHCLVSFLGQPPSDTSGAHELHVARVPSVDPLSAPTRHVPSDLKAAVVHDVRHASVCPPSRGHKFRAVIDVFGP